MKKTMGLALAALLAFGVTAARAADQFYAGKAVNLVVGYAPGGGYAAYAQVIAKHLGKHIPGEPTIVVQHMPGAGSIVAANHLFNVAKPDGLTIGSVNMFNLYSNYMAKEGDIHFDLTSWSYVGNARSGNAVFLGVGDTIPSLDAMKRATKPITVGAAVPGDGHHMFSLAVAEGLGLNLRNTFGYSGGGEIDLALERKEIDARVANLNSYLISKPDWIKSGFVKILIQNGMTQGGEMVRDPRIGDVPTLRELAPNNVKVRQLMNFASVSELLALVYLAPPKTPPAQLAILRDGFQKMLADADFLAEAEKFKLEITPMDARDVEQIVKRSLEVDPEVLELIKQIKK